MSMSIDIKTVIKEAWNHEVTYNLVDLDFSPAAEAETFKKEGIYYTTNDAKTTFCRYDKAPDIELKESNHEYVMPAFGSEVLALMKGVMNGESQNILLTGPAGSGKTEFVREIAKLGGFAKVYQVNGRDDMDSSDFYGDKTVVVDQQSKQNYIKFNKGPLYKAFIEGTEVDADGNQILYDEDGNITADGTGNPKVIGKPGLFFLDEFAALLPGVFLSVFNRAMEIPRKRNACRSIEITTDGGRVVKSHPYFAMFLSGNTVGKGTESESQMGFTAQNNQMDDSTLNRITATYSFGYNLSAERHIMTLKFNDDRETSKLCQFRDEIRKQWQSSNVETLLSTRAIVSICNLARTLKSGNMKDAVPLAIYRSVFTGLRERETHAWNETIRMVYGVDVMRQFGNNSKEIFYATKF